ncbi:hypothetical protein KIW84_057491 [Lathyrus oleraceus]|uniref:PB1-like domain-containing protein n=1 Tax=Pisum sativum TaxID=3888 RepID=A0A9D5AMZ4_PEA|nr:hypothetical protein KIW84_057491 [Pisum sativum]
MSFTYYPPSSRTKGDPKFCTRPSQANAVTLTINHRGGTLLHYPCKFYLNGKLEDMNWKWDIDFMSYMDIKEVIKKLGYIRIKCMWYHDLKYSFEHGVKPINNDKDVLKFGEEMSGYEIASIYVEHVVNEPTIITEDEVREFVEPIQEPINIESDEREEVQVEEREELQSE